MKIATVFYLQLLALHQTTEYTSKNSLVKAAELLEPAVSTLSSAPSKHSEITGDSQQVTPASLLLHTLYTDSHRPTDRTTDPQTWMSDLCDTSAVKQNKTQKITPNFC